MQNAERRMTGNTEGKMSWVRTDERKRIWEASWDERDGWTRVDADMRGWTLLDGGVPVYAVTDEGRVRKRTDQEIKRDKRMQNAE